MEDENRLLKQMISDLSLEYHALKVFIEKSFKSSDKEELVSLSYRPVCHELTSGMQDFVAEQNGISLAEEHVVMVELIRSGKPTQHAFVEQSSRTFRTEIEVFYLFRTLNEAREVTNRWLNITASA
ncbi:TPA: transposase, partial [Enterobacter kobei]|nr:transposase [Enterobacter kobei]